VVGILSFLTEEMKRLWKELCMIETEGSQSIFTLLFESVLSVVQTDCWLIKIVLM